MKVECIADGLWYSTSRFVRKNWWSKKKRRTNPGPKRGEIVTVEKEVWDEGEKYYRLIEWPTAHGEPTAYEAKQFKPLQESATEFEEVTYSEIKKEVPVSAN